MSRDAINDQVERKKNVPFFYQLFNIELAINDE